MNNKSKFTADYNKGFSMTFDNGLCISVQFGFGNYCDNNHFPGMSNPTDHLKLRQTTSSNAEICIWDTNSREDADGTYTVNETFNFGHDTVQGYIETNEVAEWIYFVSQAKDLQDLYDKATQFKLLMPA